LSTHNLCCHKIATSCPVYFSARWVWWPRYIWQESTFPYFERAK